MTTRPGSTFTYLPTGQTGTVSDIHGERVSCVVGGRILPLAKRGFKGRVYSTPAPRPKHPKSRVRKGTHAAAAAELDISVEVFRQRLKSCGLSFREYVSVQDESEAA